MSQIATWAEGAGRALRRAFPKREDPRGDRLKWYMGTNEAGSLGGSGLHAKLAVLSARRNTRLEPHLITTGFRNALTEWMEGQGVKLIDAAMPLAPAIEAGALRGTYSRDYLGHWLRCEVPLIEHDDDFVLYTDTDIVFFKPLRLAQVRPPVFACAPEFRLEGANYVNTGVMVMNVPHLRDTAPAFLAYAADEIGKVVGHYHDQYAYNRFYREQWTPLDPLYNWKPYWPAADASILHFHGAKLHAIRMLYEGKGDYSDAWWRIIGSLVASFRPTYAAAIRATLAATAGADLAERPWIEDIAHDLETRAPPVPDEAIDLSFMNYDIGY